MAETDLHLGELQVLTLLDHLIYQSYLPGIASALREFVSASATTS